MKNKLMEYINEISTCDYIDIVDYFNELNQCSDEIKAMYLSELVWFIAEQEAKEEGTIL